MNARIWLGFDFRPAMTDGNRLGQDDAAFVLGHAFQPMRGHDRHRGDRGLAARGGAS